MQTLRLVQFYYTKNYRIYNIQLNFYYSHIKLEDIYFVIRTSFSIIGFKNLDIDEQISYPGFSRAEWNR